MTESITDSTQKEYYMVVKNDGSEHVGEIISDDGREVLLLTQNIGKIYINKSDIASMKKLEADKIKVTKDGVYQDLRLEGP